MQTPITLLIVAVAIGAGIWLGISEPAGRRSALMFGGLGLLLLAISVVIYSVQCDGNTVIGIILFREVPGEFFCNGRFTFAGHMFLVAALVAGFRACISWHAE